MGNVVFPPRIQLFTNIKKIIMPAYGINKSIYQRLTSSQQVCL